MTTSTDGEQPQEKGRAAAALRHLREEHVLIRRVVEVMDAEQARLASGADVDPLLWQYILDFSRGYADARHHQKEEKLLFPALAGKSETIRLGPVKVLTAEHESGRYFASELERAIESEAGGEVLAARERATRALALYARMLRHHIEKEEEIVFLLAEVLLDEEEARRIEAGFKAIDRELGSDDHFRELVARLEDMRGDLS